MLDENDGVQACKRASLDHNPTIDATIVGWIRSPYIHNIVVLPLIFALLAFH
jgi:hypothetical protein